jgi:hypothetical protein
MSDLPINSLIWDKYTEITGVFRLARNAAGFGAGAPEMSPRTGPRMAEPVSWAIISRLKGAPSPVLSAGADTQTGRPSR